MRTNPGTPGVRADAPLVTTSMLRCRDGGSTTESLTARTSGGRTFAIDDYPNAGSSFAKLMQLRIKTKRASLDRQSVSIACGKLPFMEDTNEWDTGPVWTAVIQDVAARAHARSVLVPMVVIGDSGGEWTNTEFAAFLFADNGTLLWKSSGFDHGDDTDQVAARIIDQIPADLGGAPGQAATAHAEVAEPKSHW
jgi:hypothetical protein